MSVEGTLSMDCTVMGAPPPMATPPAITCFELLRCIQFPFPYLSKREARLPGPLVCSLSLDNAENIVKGDDHCQPDKQNETHRVDIALVFGGDGVAGDALPEEEQQPSSV